MPTIARGRIESQRGWWDAETFAKVEACPREREHQYGPAGYVPWHEWAEKRSKTHRQIRCECGLYLLHERLEP